MSWMAWTAIGTGIAAAFCFLRGAFALSWEGLPWLFWCAIFFAMTVAFGVSAMFAH